MTRDDQGISEYDGFPCILHCNPLENPVSWLRRASRADFIIFTWDYSVKNCFTKMFLEHPNADFSTMAENLKKNILLDIMEG